MKAAPAYANTMNTDGSWSYLDYDNQYVTNWEPIYHLVQLLRMSFAYTMFDSDYYGNEILYEAIMQGLYYWYEKRPSSKNWYANQISAPEYICRILAVMEFGKKKTEPELKKELIELKNFQPYNLSFLGLLCEFYMQTSQVDKVQPVLDEMLSLDPDNGLTFLTYALYCKINYKTDCFFDCLNKAFKSDLVSLQQKTVILHQLVLEDIDYSSEKLIPLFDILSEKYSDSLSVHNLYASYLMREQLYSQAGEELRKGLDCDKSDFNTWKKLFKLYTFTEEYEKLSEVSDMASEYYPEQIDVMIYSGVAAVYSGDYKAARDIFEQAMSFGAEVSESAYLYYFYLGVLDFKQNKKQDAYKNFDKFYQANHSDYNLVGQYANYLCEGKFNLDFAEKIIKQCVAFDGTDSYFYYVYANCMYMKNDLKSAQYFIEKSLSLGNTQKYYVYELAGDIFYKNKNCEKAVQNWNEALNLGGNVVKIDKKIKTCN